MRALSHSDSGAQPYYPAAVDVALRDGSTIHVRPAVAEDRPAIEAFLHGLSPEAIGFRFFGAVDLSWAAGWSTDMEGSDGLALVATSGPDQVILAHAAYVVTQPGPGGGRVHGRRRLAAARRRHADARPARGRRRRERGQRVHGPGDAVEPPHGPGLPRQRLQGEAALAQRRHRGRVPDLARRAHDRALRAARADRGHRSRRALPAPVGRRRDRRLGQARDGRRRTAAQPALLRLPGAAVSRQPAHARDRRPEGLHHDRRGARARRPRGDRRPGRAGVRRRTRMRRRRLAGRCW